jgi:hypothetical protein
LIVGSHVARLRFSSRTGLFERPDNPWKRIARGHFSELF